MDEQEIKSFIVARHCSNVLV